MASSNDVASPAAASHVQAAASVQEAREQLAQAKEQERAVELVFVDQVMPAQGGLALAEALREEADLGGARCVVFSPFGARLDPAVSEQLALAAVLTKPVRRSGLRRALSAGFSLELDPPAPLPSRSEEETGSEPSDGLGSERVSGVSILLVEDNPVNQKLAIAMLKRLGHRVDLACNGREAVEATERRGYDLVLMDCQMPEMDGFEATRRIREYEGEGEHQLVVAMTANAMVGDRERCLEAGMDDYVSKPVSLERIQGLLEQWFGDEAKLEPAAGSVASEKPASSGQVSGQ